MPLTKNEYKVYISYPKDVQKERDLVFEICADINTKEGSQGGYSLKPVDWQESAPKIMTGQDPQAIIDQTMDREDPDLYLGIMWTRYGSDMRHGSVSPTEHEFWWSYKRFKSIGKPIVSIWFKQDNPPIFKTHEQIEQQSKVLDFKNKLVEQKLGLYGEFNGEADFNKKIRDHLLSLITNWDTHTSVPDKQLKKKYSKVPDYVTQQVYRFKEDRSDDIDLIQFQQSITIFDLVNQERNIVLIGDAGIGKTAALQELAWKNSSKDSPYYPCFIRLNTYTDQKIDSFIPKIYKEINPNQLLLLLDGLDEVESSNKFTAIRNIEFFAEHNPKIRIIISCRTNFYRTPSNFSSGTLDRFTPYQLLPFDQEKLFEYSSKLLGEETDKFLLYIQNLDITELFQIPFYLIKALKYSKSRDFEFDSKATLLEKIFNSLMFADIDHFRTTIDLEDEEKEIITQLKKLAVGMESLGRNYITNVEYEKLIPDKNNRTLLKHSSAWKLHNDEPKRWSFEHNNLQEYLAAKALSELDFDEVQRFLSIDPDFIKVNPTWVNTLSFLFSILPKKNELLSEILEWLKDIEPELLVKFEPDKVDAQWRFERFKEIFNNYKSKEIWINRDKYRYRELAKFGESDETTEFLLAEIEKKSHKIVLSNAIELLIYMKHSPKFLKSLSEQLTSISLSTEFGENVQFIALMAIAELQLSNDYSLDKIIQTLSSSTSDYVRAGLYHLLKKTENVDKYIDVIIDGFDLISSNLMSTHRKSRLLDEVIQLKSAISRINNPKSFEQVVKYFTKNPNQINDIFDEKTYDKFIQNAIEIATESKSVTDTVLLILGTLVDEHLTTMVEQTLKFFDDTNSRFSSFKSIYMDRRNIENSDLAIGALANSEALRYLITEYNENTLDDGDINRIRLGLSLFNHEKLEEFDILLSSETADRFVLPVQRDFTKEREERLIFDINLLFNKEEFINQLNLIFENENKISFESSELFRLGAHADENRRYSNIVLTLLRDYAGKAKISHEYAIEIVNRLDWDDFAVGRLYNYHEHNSKFQLHPKQVKFVKKWCFSKLNSSDFTKAMTVNKNGSIGINTTANLLWFFMHRYKFEYPEKKLLEMLSFDSLVGHDFRGIGYIEKRVSESKVRSRILKNLEKGIQAYPVLKNHLNYCKKKRLKESVKYATEVIKNNSWYDDIRILALDTIIEIENSLQKVESVLNDITDDFKWIVVKSLIENGSTKIEDFLLKVIRQVNKHDKYQSSIHLMKLDNIEGLRYFVFWTKDNMKYHEDDFSGSPIVKITSVEAIPLLFELLEIGHMKKLKDDDFFPLRAAVMNTLSNIALESQENFSRVKSEVTIFIKSNLNKYPNTKFLDLDLERLEQRYYVNKAEKITIDEVTERLSSIF